MRVLMRPIGRRAPPCSLRELPPSGEKALFDTEMASRGSEYSEPLSYVVLTLKNAYAGHEKEKGPLRCAFGAFSERDCLPPRSFAVARPFRLYLTFKNLIQLLNF